MTRSGTTRWPMRRPPSGSGSISWAVTVTESWTTLGSGPVPRPTGATIVHQLREQRVPCVFVSGRQIALWRTGGTVYATDDVCSHMQASLSDGHADAYTITCPRHGGQFDMRTGAALKMPAFAPIAVFPVEVRDGRVYLDHTSL